MTDIFRLMRPAIALSAILLAGTASAVTINEGLTDTSANPTSFNTIEDQDRETYYDNGDGVLSVGDVFVGFVRMDGFLPSGEDTDNQVYGVISNQITEIYSEITGLPDPTGRIIELGTTTVAGLTIQELTGDATTTGGMFAIYDSQTPYASDLVLAPVGTSMKDNIDFIVAGGDLMIVAGLSDAADFLHVTNTVGFNGGTPNAVFASLPTSITTGNFTGGLTDLVNNTNFEFLDTIFTVNAFGAIVQSNIGIGNGAVRGAIGDGNEAIFANGGYPGLQCSTQAGNTPCGFVTDADFFVDAKAPVPGTLGLIGGALIGLAFMRRKVKKA